MKKSIIILLLFVVLLGFNFNVLASESTLISKAAQELVINSDLSSQEIKDLQMKLNKQLNANIDSETIIRDP
ncbi:MAG: hypothetical protein U5K53_08660 [Halanaerobiales bacterium]|nr:hypothetical protein [Halanaerobiales bacterium]